MNQKQRDLADSLSRRAHPALVLLAGALALMWANDWRLRLKEGAAQSRRTQAWLARRETAADADAAEHLALRNLKRQDVSAFKQGLASLTQSKRAIYEAGLALQEEKRLLEKQWEVMTTYLMVDDQAKRIHVMRGEQSLESFSLQGPGRLHAAGVRPPPSVAQIVSKERFAHPERGASVEQDGQLQWSPPQVGNSLRANALGQFVMFTQSSLILHGPPAKAAEHSAFPHYCLELSLPTARKLYAASFIGTKVLFKLSDPPKPSALTDL